MTVNTHKKARKLRGSRTHGWGSPKKHRGAGSRGGVGMAGSGKKGQQKLNRLKKLDYKKIGKTQFKRPLKTIINDKTINLSTICEKIEYFIKKGIATKKKDTYEIDLTKTDYTKVLGSGSINLKIHIKADKFSKKAIEKITANGGNSNPTVADEKLEESGDSTESQEGVTK